MQLKFSGLRRESSIYIFVISKNWEQMENETSTYSSIMDIVDALSPLFAFVAISYFSKAVYIVILGETTCLVAVLTMPSLQKNH